MSNDYPQDLMVDPVYVESGGESALAESLEQVERDYLVDEPDDLGVHEPLFATMISRDISKAESEEQIYHQEFTVYSRGAVTYSNDTTCAFRFGHNGKSLAQKWVEDLMSEGASTFTGERPTPNEPPTKPFRGTGMLYNHWHTNSACWQDSIDGIGAPPIVYETHQAVRETLEDPMRAAADSPEETGWIKTDTVIADDASIDDTQYPLDQATSI